jgi:hypothetical protein
VLALYAFLRVQHLGLFGHPYVGGTTPPQRSASQAFGTAVSFVTNTNLQSYSGESALGYAAGEASGSGHLRPRAGMAQPSLERPFHRVVQAGGCHEGSGEGERGAQGEGAAR